MSKRIFVIVLSLVLIFSSMNLTFANEQTLTQSVKTVVFGPEKFTRTDAKPQKIVKTFTVNDTNANYTLDLQNGESRSSRSCSAVVTLNGETIITPDSFNKKVENIQIPITVQETNELTVELRSAPGTSVVISISCIKPATADLNKVTLSTDALFVNEPENITMKISIPYNTQGSIPVVNLQRLDDSGNVIANEAVLTDDGNLSNGDEIYADGIFSTRKQFVSASEGRIPLRIECVQDGNTRYSDVFYIDVFTHLTDAQLENILSFQSTGEEQYNQLINDLGEAKAKEQMLAQVLANPEVSEAGLSDGGNIWIVYSSGIVGAISVDKPGYKGGNTSERIATETSAQVIPSPEPDVQKNLIKSRKAIILSPFHADFQPDDESPTINNMLSNASDPSYDVVYKEDDDVTVESFKDLYKYGIIAISSHGDTYYKGIKSLWTRQFGWEGDDGVVVIFTGEDVTKANKATYEKDLKKGRLAINADIYAITPSFITFYASSRYPNSLVYMSACRSTFNNTMANAFIDSGAGTYLGYSEYVLSSFATRVGTEFFQRFIEDPNIATSGEAFIDNQDDGQADPAFFQMIGSDTLEPPTDGLVDGNFESGNLEAWKVSGDGRIISQLGEFNAREGNYMSIISTGLGYTTSSGSIEQSFMMPVGSSTLTFNYNFCSEEFMEWVGSGYQDYFKVDIITESGTHNLLYKKIDDLSTSVKHTTLSFDQGDVWATDWYTFTVDISDIAEANVDKPVTIRFSAGDVGDSIFDTAILIDNIIIQ